LPLHYTKDDIEKILGIFGKLKHVEPIIDPATSVFRGQAYVDYETEMESKKALNGAMGLKIEDNVLFVKRLTAVEATNLALASSGDSEVFKKVIEDRPTPCLSIRGIIDIHDIEKDEFPEVEMEIALEMKRYGKLIKVHVPRPPLMGDSS
jgi:RNA recognition motif-containing protein